MDIRAVSQILDLIDSIVLYHKQTDHKTHISTKRMDIRVIKEGSCLSSVRKHTYDDRGKLVVVSK